MRNLKKVLSLALALVMLVGMMVVGAGATSFADDASIQNQEAVSVLAGLGVVKGREDGSSFDPTGTLTRAEAAMMIAQLDLGVDAAAALKANGTNPFSDVAATHWAAGAIDYCVEQGYIRGDGNGHFFPGNNVTGVEFGIMLTSLLGYDSKAEGVTGSEWQTKGAALARRAGLTNGVAAGTADMTRDGMAQMAFNALKADMVEYLDGTGTSINLPGGGSIVTGAKATKVPGTGDNTNKDYRVDTADDDTLQLCEAKFPGLRVTTKDDAFGIPTVQWYVGKKADSAYDADDVIAKGETSGVLATYTDDVGDVTKGQLVKLGLSGSVDVYENNTANSTINVGADKFATDKALGAYKGATVYVVDDNGKKEIRVVYGYLAQVTKVTEASSTRDRSINLKVYRDNAGTSVSGYVTEGFEKDQWVMVYPTGKKIGVTFTAADIAEVKAVADADMVMGSVSKVDGTNGTGVTALTVDSKYAVGGTGLALMAPGTDVARTTYSFSTDYTLFLSNGYVIGVSGEESTADIGDIVYVTRASWSATDSYGVTTYNTEVVNMDGTTAILPNITRAATGSSSDPGYVSAYEAPTAPGFYTVADKNGKKEFTTLATVNKDATNITDANPFAAETLGNDVAMTEKTNSIVAADLTHISSLRAYVTSGTRLLFIGTGTGADLKVTLETGAMKQTLPNTSNVLLSKNSAGNLIVEAIILGTSKVDVNGEVVYVKADSKTGTDSVGDLWTIYKTDGTEDEVHVAKGTTPDAGFATYSVDDKGVHTFSPVAAASTGNGDGKYALSATPVSVFTSSSLISTTSLGQNLTDADASEATVIDLTGGEDTLDLNGLNNKKITGAIFVRDGKVESIVVTTAAEKSKGTKATYVSEPLANASTDEYFEVTLGGITVNVASDKTTVDDQAEAWTGAYSKTDWKATVNGAKVTLTCDATTKYSDAGDGAAAKAAAGVNAGTFTPGNGSDTAAKIELTLAEAVASTSKVKVTISGKDYYVAKSNDTRDLQLDAWRDAYNADAANKDYTADVGTDTNAGKIVLTAEAVGVKDDNGKSTNVTVRDGGWTDGTAAE